MNFLANGDIAKLRRLRRFEDFYGFRFATAVLSFADYNDAELECKILLDTIASESPSLTREESNRLFARWKRIISISRASSSDSKKFVRISTLMPFR